MTIRSTTLFVILLGLTPRFGGAQTAPSGEIDLLLKEAICHGPHENITAGKACRLGDTVQVTFTNLSDWIRADPVKHDPSRLVIALNAHALDGTHANVMAANSNILSFDMTAPEGTDPDSEANKQAWRAILRGYHSQADVLLFVGPKGGNTFYGPLKVAFKFFPPYSPLVFVLIGGLVLGVGWLAFKSGLIRADGPDPGPGLKRPYSLGRMQMAWWFLLVSASYLFIWLITDNRDSLTTGVLILTGISAATGLGSQVVGKSNSGSAASPVPPVSSPDAVLTPAPPAPRPPANPPASRGFINDILGDETGVSFDRFQMAAWTIVLGIVFATEVMKDLTMPDFSPTLLGLMGISSGTYIGFKLPGKNS